MIVDFNTLYNSVINEAEWDNFLLTIRVNNTHVFVLRTYNVWRKTFVISKKLHDDIYNITNGNFSKDEFSKIFIHNRTNKLNKI